MNILVTGGAGYIGSHTVLKLGQAGYNPISYDNLSSGCKEAILAGDLIVADLANKSALNKVFKENKITAVMHLAALTSVAESVVDPEKYIKSNYTYGLNLLETMLENEVDKIVFSSSAAVYGDQEEVPMKEDAPLKPKNAYAESKAMFEKALADYAEQGLKYVTLRYFNAAGAHPNGKLGFTLKNEPTLIIAAILSALDQKKPLYLYGSDYSTADGTCIRDYVHVCDLAQAHADAVKYLLIGGRSTVINLGSGNGYSNYQVIDLVKKISGVNFKVIETQRRTGDLAVSIADISRARDILKWTPNYDLKAIVNSALEWQKSKTL